MIYWPHYDRAIRNDRAVKRIEIPERSDWRAKAEELGFGFHTMYGEPYWDETRTYVFTIDQIENDLEDVSGELYAMCLDVVDFAIGDAYWLEKLAIPEVYWDWIAASWRDRAPSLYGRFDLAYDGAAPAKMLEFNADTPTALYETGYFQWNWLQDQKARGLVGPNADQFNSLQDKMIARLAEIFEPGCHLHVACCKDTDEDRATVRYIEDCAVQAGMNNHFVHVEDIGIDGANNFADLDGVVIDNLFKLYPYEDLFREPFGPALMQAEMTLLEPPWKALLSNKGLLPLLWRRFRGHPNLLPSYFDGEVDADFLDGPYVRKPIFSREGANVEVHFPDAPSIVSEGPYGAEGWIIQGFHQVPKFDQDYAVIGSWIVGEQAAGIGVREDRSLVTKDLSRFVPHLIDG